MKKIIKFFKELFQATSNRDKVIIGLYLFLFVPLGTLMKFGVIPYPDTVMSWINDIINSANDYVAYIFIFFAVQITNIVSMFGFVAAEDGFIRLIKRSNSDYGSTDDWLGIIASFVCMTVALSVNLMMFPMFVPVYIVIGIAWALLSAK